MGLFEAMGVSLNRAQATATIEQLLDRQVEYGVLDGHPRTLAEHAVSQVWTLKPALFEGKIGPRPHKLAIAAIALAAAARSEAYRGNEILQGSYTLALGFILDEIAGQAGQQPFQDVDLRLFDIAATTLSECPEALQHSPHIDWYGL
ncbi:hypothetical protein [Dyella sp. 20L07]|uniref:hypothetical protein n=1 Tax=Dyella sp. 20L07 TaxID=3384240 RepID=UPI003D281051